MNPAGHLPPVGRAMAVQRSPVEAFTVDCFKEILQVAECRPDDSFFRLGGDSLQALRLLSRLNRRYPAALTLADVFEARTPSEMTRRLAAGTCGGMQVPTAERGRTEFPLALSQQTWYQMDRLTGGAGFFNIVIRLVFSGDIDPAALRDAVADVAVRQPVLRSVFGERDGQVVQRVTDELPTVPEIDIRHTDRKRSLDRLIRREHLVGFDLHEQAPIRFTLARTGETDWCLLACVHHVAFDGVSVQILVEELATAYRYRSGIGELGPKPAWSYGDFAAWEQEVICGERLEAALNDLRERVARTVPSISPADVGDLPDRHRSHVEALDLPEETARGIEETARLLDTTTFTVLVAAILSLLRRRTGEQWQPIVFQAANRTLPGSENVIGCFAGAQCVTPDLSGYTSPEDIVAGVHRDVSAALRHESVPMDHALDLMAHQDHDLVAADQLPQVAFALQPQSRFHVELPGCSLDVSLPIIEGTQIDPTTFRLVVELSRDAGTGLRGLTQRLVAAWPGVTFRAFQRELAESFEIFAGLGRATDGQRSTIE